MTYDDGIRCMLMRGGTSKGAYFLADDLPSDPGERDALLLRVMGSPDGRQIDGIGGAHPLTSKVAVVRPSELTGVDLDYLFLQVGVDGATVSDRQNCGNLLAGVGPFAYERGLIPRARPDSDDAHTVSVEIHMANTDGLVRASFPVFGGHPDYAGTSPVATTTTIDGVPGLAAAIELEFADIAGGSCGALLPTGRVRDTIGGVEVTLVDNGMPVVVLRAADLGVGGDETPADLEADDRLRTELEAIRLEAGPLMGLGDVTDATVPKLTMVSPPFADGAISTRTFIPHRCHDAIGVFGAVSVATAALLPGSVAAGMVAADAVETGIGSDGRSVIRCEHPTGSFDATVTTRPTPDGGVEIVRAGIVRTARKLMDGIVFPRDPSVSPLSENRATR